MLATRQIVRAALTLFAVVLLAVGLSGTAVATQFGAGHAAAAPTCSYDGSTDNARQGTGTCAWSLVGSAHSAVSLTLEVADSSTPSAPGFAAEAGKDVASAARGGVYSLRDEVGNVVRTGRGKDLAARERAHFNDPELGDYRFNVEYRTDVYAEQRGLEQLLYDRHPGAQSSNGGFNKIRGISPTNPNGAGYMQSAWGFLERLGGR